MNLHAGTLWKDAMALWTFFTLYFAVGIRKIRVKRSAPSVRLTMESFGIVLATLLIFFPATHVGALATRFVSHPALRLTGFCVTVIGLAFAAWSRDVLGNNWSAHVMIQAGHRLIVAGPYSYLRHPLYTGVLMALAGTVTISGECGALLGWLMAAAYFYAKASREEELLRGEFGTAYFEYIARTGFLLPRISHV